MEKENNYLKKEIIKHIKNDKPIPDSLLKDYYAVDVAETLSKLETGKIKDFTDLLDNEDLAEIIEQSEEEIQIEILKTKNIEQITDIISYMAKDNIADIFGNLPIGLRKKLLVKMKKDEANTLKKLLGYDEESAGGLMTTEYILLEGEMTVGEAINKIKKISPKTEIIETIFIVDESNKLAGFVNLRDILVTNDSKKLKELMDENVITVTPEIDQEEVALQVAKYDLSVMPVINKNNNLLGIITFDDIIDVIEAENTEDMFRMVGISEEESVNSTIPESIKKRLPWLYINLGTAFLAALTVGLFEDVIVQVVALAAAMPIVAGMGGNAGTQTLSIVIRGIALGELKSNNKWKLAVKESSIGIIHGAAIGIATGVILYFLYGNPYLGLIIFAAMVLNLLIAGLFGFLIPITLQALGIDPALASAIFLTTVTDVFGFFVFLGLAKVFINYL
ncbi:MAG TPA: magnesium transporter [Halanaerobiales bacterium]|nr:magnesium transporter [Halanaerobiales bacterium]